MPVLWMVALILIWLALISTRGAAEIAAGVLTAGAAAWWIAAARSHGILAPGLASFQPMRKVGSLLPKLIVESYLVAVSTLLALAGGSQRGSFRETHLPPGAPERGAVDRGLFTLIESFTPNEYVIALDEGRQVALVHELADKKDG